MLPTRAPYAVPSPPRVTAAKISSRIWKPIWKLMPWARPSRTPASPASIEPVTHTTRMTRSTSMPEAAASAGLSATARVALPIRVRSSARMVASRTTTAARHRPAVHRGQADGPEVDALRAPVVGVLPGRAGEQVEVEVAQEDAQADRDDHRRDQPGPASAQWRPQGGVVEPAEQAARDQGDRGCREELQAAEVRQERQLARAQPPGEQRADRHELAVGEVGQPGRAEDQRQPDRGQRHDQAEPQAFGGELGRLASTCSRPGGCSCPAGR